VWVIIAPCNRSSFGGGRETGFHPPRIGSLVDRDVERQVRGLAALTRADLHLVSAFAACRRAAGPDVGADLAHVGIGTRAVDRCRHVLWSTARDGEAPEAGTDEVVDLDVLALGWIDCSIRQDVGVGERGASGAAGPAGPLKPLGPRRPLGPRVPLAFALACLSRRPTLDPAKDVPPRAAINATTAITVAGDGVRYRRILLPEDC
jgi:hypothetical protein